jgi:hypothetical protein
MSESSESRIDYPMLYPVDRNYVSQEPVHEEIELSSDSSEEEEKVAEPKQSKLKKVLKSGSTKIKALAKKQKDEEEVPLTGLPSLNPEASAGPSRLVDLIQNKATVNKLLQAGFRPESMQDEGVYLEEIYEAQYDVRQLHQLIPEWEQLIDAGFNKSFLGTRWHIDALVTYYERPKGELCQELGFEIRDFMLAQTTPMQFKELGINADTLVKMNASFEELFAMHFTLEDMQQHFGVTKDHILGFKLNHTQRRALAQCRGWTAVEMGDQLGMSYDELRAIGMELKLA